VMENAAGSSPAAPYPHSDGNPRRLNRAFTSGSRPRKAL